jgi:hypothetical protein
MARGTSSLAAARAVQRAKREAGGSLIAIADVPFLKEQITMPQSASQRNRQAATQPKGSPKPMTELAPTSTEDQVYGLVSVLYHALQGAQACEQYIEDAEKAGDDALLKFFEECRDQQNERAGRAKSLLVERVDEESDEDDDDSDDDDDDSDDEA